MRAADVKGDVGKRRHPSTYGYRPTPEMADLMKSLGLSVQIADMPANMEMIAAHLSTLDERLADIEERLSKGKA